MSSGCATSIPLRRDAKGINTKGKCLRSYTELPTGEQGLGLDANTVHANSGAAERAIVRKEQEAGIRPVAVAAFFALCVFGWSAEKAKIEC